MRVLGREIFLVRDATRILMVCDEFYMNKSIRYAHSPNSVKFKTTTKKQRILLRSSDGSRKTVQ